MGSSLGKKERSPSQGSTSRSETNDNPGGGTSRIGDKKKPVHHVMISYSHKDDEYMLKLKARLNKEKITYWVDHEGLNAGANFITRIGEAVLEAKALVPIISENYIESKYCKDELALAYLSSKPIIAIGLQTRTELDSVMDTGIRLQMARQDWFDLNNGMDECLDQVIEKIKQVIEGDSGAGPAHGGHGTTEEEEGRQEFWTKHFKEEARVPWDRFLGAFEADYGEIMLNTFGESCRGKVTTTVHRELDVPQNDGFVLKGVYNEFSSRDVNFWTSVRRQFAEDLATDEVLGMSSTVRVDFIEYLGKCKSKRIVEALLDLLERGETDSQVTAAISLARTGDNSQRVIEKLMTCLESKDRLVRESGCLALGHLKAKEAVPKLIELWRSDVIADVRQATEISLKRIGGEEAGNAIEVTNVLSSEIRQLTQENEGQKKT